MNERAEEHKEMAKKLKDTYLCLVNHPECRMTSAMAHTLVHDDDTLETLLWLQRYDALVLSSKPRIIGMLMVSGPRNCGKSWLVGSRMISFLGDARTTDSLLLASS